MHMLQEVQSASENLLVRLSDCKRRYYGDRLLQLPAALETSLASPAAGKEASIGETAATTVESRADRRPTTTCERTDTADTHRNSPSTSRVAHLSGRFANLEKRLMQCLLKSLEKREARLHGKINTVSHVMLVL